MGWLLYGRHCSLSTALWAMYHYYPNLQTRKLKHREAKLLAKIKELISNSAENQT